MSAKGPVLLTEIIVTVDSRCSLDRVVDNLRYAGMDVQQVLARSGIVIGAVEEHAASSLARVDGVLAIEEEGTKHAIA